MPSTIPADVMARMKERSTPRLGRPLPWGQIMVLLIALGVIGWYVYQKWIYRVPQERVLTLQNGKKEDVLIDSRGQELIEVTPASGGGPILMSIAALSLPDQEFISHLGLSLRVAFPYDSVLTDSKGKTTPVQWQARDENWVKLAYLSDHSQTVLPISSLSDLDQSLVKLMPVENLSFPINYVLTGPPKEGMQVKLIGHNKDVYGYSLPSEDAVHYALVSELSPTDQRFLSDIPDALALNLPLDCTVQDRLGHPIPVHIIGRFGDYIVLKDPAGGNPDYRLLSDFSTEDQKALKYLDATKPPQIPFDFTLVDPSNHSAAVLVTGLTKTDVSIRLTNGVTTSYPLSKLSVDNQEFLAYLYNTSDHPPESPEIKRLRDEVAALKQHDLYLQSMILAPNTSALEADNYRKELFSDQQQIESDNFKIMAESPGN